MVFAYHTEDPETENDFKQHTFRGSRSILLLNNMDKKQINETGWRSFVVQNKNVRTYTTYTSMNVLVTVMLFDLHKRERKR